MVKMIQILYANLYSKKAYKKKQVTLIYIKMRKLHLKNSCVLKKQKNNLDFNQFIIQEKKQNKRASVNLIVIFRNNQEIINQKHLQKK
ncbi:hypothetical protein TTHERM_000535809 (macronuclear) [Tetrahymena thermophila SB210]|uniref:Uncharacterized protein n=1 Tax=Tetrahymena thermophila (strain SB210) TaxID=312017 RepID=W7X451_TETTS|nr:hypothetical protein TTHERM_000535809 [Tetrahymena thermophila SB210]EWS72212.1 hypothetical protein TTHERM_000535809 [Tetrahymena thermophila SB210]|eukprot:XP_012655255.1 hypothetical protein TTHERM_000535809 [Tetrahymena thermophila SB210]